MRCTTEHLEHVPTDVYRQFYSLNFRGCSPMRQALVKYRRRFREAWAIWLSDDSGKVLGWSLVTPGRLPGQLRASFYVRHAMRRKGLGKRLIKAVNRLAQKQKCSWGYFDHDARSTGFFKATTTANHKAFSVYKTPGVHAYYYQNGQFAFWGDKNGNRVA